jgi:hypothetical protein
MTFVLWPGCAGRPTTPEAPASSPAASPATANIAPPPFTVEQLRAGLPVGTVLSYSMQPGASGSYVQQYRVVAADATSVTMVSVKIYSDGRTEESPPAPTPWSELVSHAHFPADRTRIFNVQVTTYAGSFSTRAYEVTDPTGVVSTYYFALDQPGPPVLYTVKIDNKRSSMMSLMSREQPAR